MCVRVTAKQNSDIFWDTVYIQDYARKLFCLTALKTKISGCNFSIHNIKQSATLDLFHVEIT